LAKNKKPLIIILCARKYYPCNTFVHIVVQMFIGNVSPDSLFESNWKCMDLCNLRFWRYTSSRPTCHKTVN